MAELDKQMDYSKFSLYAGIIECITYQEDANKFLIDIYDKTNDPAQLNTFRRMIKKKDMRKNHDSFKSRKLEIISKKCPHCKKIFISDNNEDYVVCGYTAKGHDWKGCGRDWCFTCGKKLCKCWEVDLLFDEINRNHDGKCCKIYAQKNGELYPVEYCQCTTKYVDRHKI